MKSHGGPRSRWVGWWVAGGMLLCSPGSPAASPTLSLDRPQTSVVEVAQVRASAPVKASFFPTAGARRPVTRCTFTYLHPLLNRCETWIAALDPPPAWSAPPAEKPQPLSIEGDVLQRRLAVAARARSMLAQPSFEVGDRTYPQDCSGLVMAVLAAEGLPLEGILNQREEENRVAAIYRMTRERGLLSQAKVPEIGDLIFFNNTYDRNRDGQLNDPLTHIGIVERVDPDGTVAFIHHVRSGILRYKMNRFEPHVRRAQDGKVLNHYLQVSTLSSGEHKGLTGELFESFASLIR